MVENNEVQSLGVEIKHLIPNGASNQKYDEDVSFYSVNEVWSYLENHTFQSQSGMTVSFKNKCLYMNGDKYSNRLKVELNEGMTSSAFVIGENVSL